jgi:hypothetical protein
MWQMNGDELLDLLKRHKRTLRSLRLRHVLLRTDPMSNCSWRQVLEFIVGAEGDIHFLFPAIP